jgi:hypothetical protein
VNVEAIQPAATDGTLTCALVDRRSSAPLVDAHVTCVVRGGIVQVLTDTKGEFTAIFPEGTYEFIISHGGELSLMLRGIGVLAGYTQRIQRGIVRGDTSTHEAEPSSAMGGYLVDRLNKPVVDAAVTAVSIADRQTYTVKTDRFGAFVIHGIAPGSYDVAVRNTQRTLASERITIAGERQFYRFDQRLLSS